MCGDSLVRHPKGPCKEDLKGEENDSRVNRQGGCCRRGVPCNIYKGHGGERRRQGQVAKAPGQKGDVGVYNAGLGSILQSGDPSAPPPHLQLVSKPPFTGTSSLHKKYERPHIVKSASPHRGHVKTYLDWLRNASSPVEAVILASNLKSKPKYFKYRSGNPPYSNAAAGATWRVSFALLIPVVLYFLYYRVFVLKELKALERVKKQNAITGAALAGSKYSASPKACANLYQAMRYVVLFFGGLRRMQDL